MKALVLDESLEISPELHRLLRTRAAESTFVCSPYELQLTEGTQGPPDLRLINLSPGLSAWEVARLLRLGPPHGLTLVLYDGDPFEHATHVTHTVIGGRVVYDREEYLKLPFERRALPLVGGGGGGVGCCLGLW